MGRSILTGLIHHSGTLLHRCMLDICVGRTCACVLGIPSCAWRQLGIDLVRPRCREAFWYHIRKQPSCTSSVNHMVKLLTNLKFHRRPYSDRRNDMCLSSKIAMCPLAWHGPSSSVSPGSATRPTSQRLAWHKGSIRGCKARGTHDSETNTSISPSV